MPVIDISGQIIYQYDFHQTNLIKVIADKIDNNSPNKNILLLLPHELENIPIVQNLINKKFVDLVIVEMASHATDVPTESSSNELSKNFGIPVLFLSSNMEYFYTNHDHVVFFPFWLLAAQEFPKNNLVFGSELDIYRKHQIATSPRNLKHRKHRLYFYGKLLQTNFADKVRKNFFKYDDFDFNHLEYSAGLSFDEWQHFKTIYDNSPYFDAAEQQAVVDTNFDIYLESYIHLVSETYTEYSFISEKTYKSFLAGQIPMILGCPGVMAMLKDLGFDIFDDVIDHKFYDSQTNFTQRVTNMLEVVQHTYTLKLDQIFAATVSRRQKNFDVIFNNKFLPSCIDILIKKLAR